MFENVNNIAVESFLQRVCDMAIGNDKRSNILWIGVVGSYVSWSIENAVTRWRDLDLLFHVRVLDDCQFDHIQLTIDQSGKGLGVVFDINYSAVPVVTTASDVLVHVLLYQEEAEPAIASCCEPYTYLHRKQHHRTLVGTFPDITSLNGFTIDQLINGIDGIRDCLVSLTAGRCTGYRWCKGNGAVRQASITVQLDTRIALEKAITYAARWALINPARATDAPTVLRDLGTDHERGALLCDILGMRISQSHLMSLVHGHLPSDWRLEEAREWVTIFLARMVEHWSPNPGITAVNNPTGARQAVGRLV